MSANKQTPGADAPKKEREIEHKPLTIDAWAEHFGTDAKSLTVAMRRVTNAIFDGDDELSRNEDSIALTRKRKKELTELHRKSVEGRVGKMLILSRKYQEMVGQVLALELPREREQYLVLTDIKNDLPRINFPQLVVISKRIREENPEWFCRTKNTNGGRPGYGLLKGHKKDFLTRANAIIDSMMQRKISGRRFEVVLPPSSDIKKLTGWGQDEASVATGTMGIGEGWNIERYE